MSVSPIPEGFHTVTPYLTVEDVAGLLKFVHAAFGAVELERIDMPDGSTKHAQVRVGNSPIMMGQAQPGWPAMPSFLHLYVEDADAVYAAALAAGAESVRELVDEFYGDRCGGVRDASGNLWWIATRKEVVSEDEIKRRMEAMDSSSS